MPAPHSERTPLMDDVDEDAIDAGHPANRNTDDNPALERNATHISQGTAFFAAISLPLYLIFTFIMVVPIWAILASIAQSGSVNT